MVLIPLASGQTAKVSDKDAPRVRRHRWYFVPGRRGSGYAAAEGPGGCRLYLHRLVAKAPKGMQVDHRNRDGLDCRRSNLRLATQRQNNGNLPLRLDSTSGFKGVVYAAYTKRWRVRVASKHVGYFNTREEAARAYNKAAKAAFGRFARLNEV